MKTTNIISPFDITTLLKDHLEKEDDRPENFLASLSQIEEKFTEYLLELETHDEFLNKYFDHWCQLTALRAALSNLKENSKDDGLDWNDHQRPYVSFIERVWKPFPKFFATQIPSATQNQSSKL